MNKKLFPITLVAACLFAASCSKDNDDTNQPNAYTIDFSNLTLEKNSHWNGSDSSGKFSSGKATFLNSYTYHADFGYESWGGFAYSNQNDTSLSSPTAQYDVYTATPNTKGVFAVGYMDTYLLTPTIPTITFDEPVALKSASFALNAYAYKSMRDGDGFAKKFAAEDWYKITIKSFDRNDVVTGSLEVYLADFRDEKSLLVDSWTKFSLAPLTAGKLTFEASSSDNGEWGMNTPAYFCIDDIAVEAIKQE
ncbi:MAG: DUF4465 domain-containing protein [Prevotellaceae bacterium]|jgi:hypothetical protein|nr:DUF4465 domain-containing protein [Prevotellaceae bacterium]